MDAPDEGQIEVSASGNNRATSEAPASSSVVCKFVHCRGLNTDIKDFSRPAATSIGQLQARLQQKLKQPAVFLSLLSQGDSFMPLPDRTLGTIAALYGTTDAEGRLVVSFAASTTTEAFP